LSRAQIVFARRGTKLATRPELKMALPRISLLGKSVFLLSGYEHSAASCLKCGSTGVVEMDKLRQAAELNPDAVAFGYVAGDWFPAA
jgi:hypothetical protein